MGLSTFLMFPELACLAWRHVLSTFGAHIRNKSIEFSQIWLSGACHQVHLTFLSGPFLSINVIMFFFVRKQSTAQVEAPAQWVHRTVVPEKKAAPSSSLRSETGSLYESYMAAR